MCRKLAYWIFTLDVFSRLSEVYSNDLKLELFENR